MLTSLSVRLMLGQCHNCANIIYFALSKLNLKQCSGLTELHLGPQKKYKKTKNRKNNAELNHILQITRV